MKEYICKEVPTDNGGYFEIENELIRCKDCKWWREDSDHTCKHFYTSPRVANDFCSYAEPKVKK